MKELSEFGKERRKEVGLTQTEFANRAGVTFTVIRKIEQNKTNLNFEKVKQVLMMFGHKLIPVSSKDLNSITTDNILVSIPWISKLIVF